jgi:hypothetical protein
MKSGLRVATVLALVVTILGACSPPWSERKPVAGGDGTTWWMIRCHRDDEGCLRQAHEACPIGYDIKERDGRKFYLIACHEPPSRGARKTGEHGGKANAPADDATPPASPPSAD